MLGIPHFHVYIYDLSNRSGAHQYNIQWGSPRLEMWYINVVCMSNIFDSINIIERVAG